MKNIKNINIAIMELYHKAESGQIKQEVAEYFIDKLDTICHEVNFANKRSGLLANNLNIFKEVGDISTFLTPKISFEQEVGKKEINLHFIEDKYSENARKVFFMKERGGSYIYLGSVIDLDSEIDNEIYLNLTKSLLSPYTYEQIAEDKMLFEKLDKNSLLKYKSFIDKNIKCLSSMTKDDKKIMQIYQKSLEKEYLSYRFDVYKKLDSEK